VTRAIVTLAADRQRCAAMGEQGRALIESELSRERAINRYERLLESVVRKEYGGPARQAVARAKVSA
jgi:glycosyltransferase involved in cell wall biosynthesis